MSHLSEGIHVSEGASCWEVLSSEGRCYRGSPGVPISPSGLQKLYAWRDCPQPHQISGESLTLRH